MQLNYYTNSVAGMSSAITIIYVELIFDKNIVYRY